MSNLLDKASIILTPTAYNNGEALCVKPSDGSGDFDFSRNSAATRVNAQGLVENVQILSSNLVQNGDFSEEGVQEVSNGSFSQEGAELVTNGDFATDSDWTKGTGWSIGNGRATYDGLSGTQQIISSGASVIPQIGKTYKVSFDVLEQGSGANSTFFGGVLLSVANLSVGSYVFYAKAVNTNRFSIFGRDGSVFSIDNVSVREVGQDWSLGTGWSIGEDKAIFDGAGFSPARTNAGLITGKTYKVTFDLDITSGNVVVQLGGATNTFNTSTTHTFYDTATANGAYSSFVSLYSSLTSNFSITNVSVKEVGQNWDLVSANASIGENKLIANSVVTENIATQSGVVPISKPIRIKFDLVLNSGGFRVLAGSGGTATNITTSGTHTLYETSGTGGTLTLQSRFGGFDGSITNISVIEITDDTNLPRINYEGFSYQDALGSELIVNGDFSNGSTDWILGAEWSVLDGKLIGTSLGAFSGAAQNVNSLSGKSLKLTFDIVDYSSGTFRLPPTHREDGIDERFSGVGSYVVYYTSTIDRIDFQMQNFNGSIDNVSVKEYLGQEVVPDSGCGSWLFEPQSTNLIPYSEDFSSGNWFEYSETSATIDASQSNPSGANGSYKIESLSGLGRFGLSAITVAPSTNYTLSFYVKNINATLLKVILGSGASPGSYTYTSEVNTSNWSRVSVNFTTGAVTSMQIQFIRDLPIGESAYIWGAQLEQQSYATSYIPTSGSSVTRNQDLCTNGATGTGLINSTEGVLYAEIARSEEENLYRLLGIDDGTSNNYVKMGFENSRGAFWIRAVINGVTSISSDNALTSNPNEFYKIAIRYQSGNSAIYINGTSVLTTTTTFSSGNFTALDFNHWNNSLNFFGKTKAVAVWKEALSDQELTELTTI